MATYDPHFFVTKRRCLQKPRAKNLYFWSCYGYFKDLNSSNFLEYWMFGQKLLKLYHFQDFYLEAR